MLKIAKALAPVLIQLQPEMTTSINGNLTKFETSLMQSLSSWQTQLNMLQDKVFIVHHDSWLYLFDWLNLKKLATLEPKPGIPPSSAHLTKLLQQVKKQNIEGIIYSSYQDDRPANWLSKRSQSPAIMLPYTVKDWQAPNALLLWYESLIQTLSTASIANNSLQ